jgi:hypothetical protein
MIPSQSIVRAATPEDRQEIWRLFLMAHNENSLFSLDEGKVNYFLDRALFPDLIHPADEGPRAKIGVIGERGKLEGLAFVLVSEYWYSRDKHIEELIIYVDPEYRKSKHARSFISWLKTCSERLSIPVVTGVMSNERTEAKCALYRRMLPKIGEFFIWNHPSIKEQNGNKKAA